MIWFCHKLIILVKIALFLFPCQLTNKERKFLSIIYTWSVLVCFISMLKIRSCLVNLIIDRIWVIVELWNNSRSTLRNIAFWSTKFTYSVWCIHGKHLFTLWRISWITNFKKYLRTFKTYACNFYVVNKKYYS